MVKKIRSLLVPYLIFILIYTILNCVGYIFVPSMFDNFHAFSLTDWLDHLFGVPFYSTPKYYEPFWFLRDLILLNVLTVALVPIVNRIRSTIIIPVMVVVWFLPLPPYIREPFVFFVIGMCFGKEKFFPALKSKTVSALLFVAAFGISYIPELSLLSRLATLIMSFAIISLSNSMVRFDGIRKWTELLIPFSFITYILHQHPLTLIQKLIAMKLNVDFTVAALLYFTLPFVIIGMCIVVASVFRKIAPKVYSVCVGNR